MNWFSMTETKSKSPARHSSHCTICCSPRRQEIEEAFVCWESPSQIAREFKLRSRLVMIRHARAHAGLIKRRDANIRIALGTSIERCSKVKPSAQAFISACIALTKLDSEGRTAERIETTGRFDDLFHRMNRGEMLRYAQTGELPPWFNKPLPSTPGRDSEDSNA
jgi:hypothetical protein